MSYRCVAAVVLAMLAPTGIACSCVDFKSVTAASQLGTALGKDKDSIHTIENDCKILVAGHLATVCPKEGGKWSLALDMVTDYATQLGKMAANEDSKVGDAVGSALGGASKANWVSLTSDQDKNISDVAGRIAAVVTQDARREYLISTIRSIHPSLDRVLEGLTLHLTEEQKYLAITRCQVACKSGIPLHDAGCQDPADGCPAPDPGLAMALASLSISLSNEDTRVVDELKAVTAFRKAHQTLYDHAENLTADEVYQAVLEDITTAFKSSGKGDGGA
jgi:hypothetical protein